MPHATDSRLAIYTAWGPIGITVRNGVVVRCELPRVIKAAAATPRVLRVELRAALKKDRRVLRSAERFVRAVLRGRAADAPPLVEEGDPSFTAACRRAMQSIRPGQTISYAELARRAGRPAAARAAGQACARNPLPLFVPCHRVRASNGNMGGFSAGLRWKSFLLDVEARA